MNSAGHWVDFLEAVMSVYGGREVEKKKGSMGTEAS